MFFITVTNRAVASQYSNTRDSASKKHRKLGLLFQCCNLPKMPLHLSILFHCFLVLNPFAYRGHSLPYSCFSSEKLFLCPCFHSQKVRGFYQAFLAVFLSFPQLHQTLNCWRGKHPQASALKRWKSCMRPEGRNKYFCVSGFHGDLLPTPTAFWTPFLQPPPREVQDGTVFSMALLSVSKQR